MHQQRRAHDIDTTVADHVGVPDIRVWLAREHAAGRSVLALAGATGRSDAWVRARLRGQTTTARRSAII